MRLTAAALLVLAAAQHCFAALACPHSKLLGRLGQSAAAPLSTMLQVTKIWKPAWNAMAGKLLRQNNGHHGLPGAAAHRLTTPLRPLVLALVQALALLQLLKVMLRPRSRQQ